MMKILHIFISSCFAALLIQQAAKSEVKPGIYWSTFVNGKIQRADFDGTNVSTLRTRSSYNFPDLSIDESANRIFYTGFGYNVPSQINRMNSNGTDNQLLYTTSDAAIRSISLDFNAGKMYWIEELDGISQGRIARANLDGSGVEYILNTSPSLHIMPYGIAFEPYSNKLYWTDSLYRKIYRCDTDGSELETLVSGSVSQLSGIVLDTDKEKMYWAERFGNIICANFDGSDVKLFLQPPSQVIDLAMDFIGNKIYWTDLDSHIYRANLDGTGISQFINTGPVYPGGITVVPIPEPATFLLFGLGGILLSPTFAVRHRNRHFR
jgi:DNA-binding beta-propeller fold protein YncE